MGSHQHHLEQHPNRRGPRPSDTNCLALAACQLSHAIRLHWLGVRSHYRMFVINCHAGRHFAQIRFAAIFHRLLQQSVHHLSLDRYDTSLYRHHHFHGSHSNGKENTTTGSRSGQQEGGIKLEPILID